jgi:predicted metal-dependent HD superfamily phosphohydrolase
MFAHVWQSLNGNPQWADIIFTRYNEPQRHYHTMDHIEHMLTLAHEQLESPPPSLLYAIVFHDIVYDPTRSDNELRSVQLWREYVQHADVAVEVDKDVQCMIEATIHHTIPPQTPTELLPTLQLFLDLDLAILGVEWSRYERYMRQIRAEYAHFDPVAFQHGRRRVLSSFLNRDVLYHTNSPYWRQMELTAREHLHRELLL